MLSWEASCVRGLKKPGSRVSLLLSIFLETEIEVGSHPCVIQPKLNSVARNHVRVLTSVALSPKAKVRGINTSSVLCVMEELRKLLIAPDKD